MNEAELIDVVDQVRALEHATGVGATIVAVVGMTSMTFFSWLSGTAPWKPSKTSLGNPPGLVAVFTISGGTALMITAFATLLSPWRAR